MAQVSISVGDISVGVEDEDATAKSLRKVAVGILDGLIAQLEAKPVDEEDGDNPAEPERPAAPPPAEYEIGDLKPQRPNEKTLARIRR